MVWEAYDWTVVIVGFWNRAILTPAGIGQRLFGLAQGTPMLVEVALDGMGPLRVKYEGLTIIPDEGRLMIALDEATLSNLNRAKEIGVRAIESLPETPLNAAGFNIRVKTDDNPNQLLNILKVELDDRLSDASFNINQRRLIRTVNWGDGDLNIAIYLADDLKVEMNFDRKSSSKEELVEWLRSPISEVEDTLKNIFNNVIQIPFIES